MKKNKSIINQGWIVGLLLMVFTGVVSGAERVQFSSMGKWKNADLYIKDSESDEMKKINLKDMSYSREYRIDEASVQLYREDKESETGYASAFAIPLSQNVKQPLIVFFRNGKKISYKVFDIHPDVFPFGSLKVFNRTRKPIAIKLGEDVRSLSQAKTASFSKDIDFQNPVWLRMQESGTRSPFLSSMVIFRTFKRVFVFVEEVEKGNGKMIHRTRSLVDFETSSE